tara:strand:- start:1805 stop:3106 length:1302 start_codon:yes stop_codon:yes gene_type:complete
MSLLLSSNTTRKRLVVLGLDGLSLELAKQLGRTFPNIHRIASNATSVSAEIPELSPVNWTSFFTGKGPEHHGVFGFSSIDPATYELSIADRDLIQCKTIFDHLGDAGITSRVVNLPNTYPAAPMKGMLVSGFVSHDLAKAAYPPFLAGKLADLNYKLEADTNRGSSDLTFLLNELRDTLRSRKQALDLLWPDLSWDLFIHVFTETDRLFHFFMDAVLHDGHPQHIQCIAFLAHWDNAIGDFLDRFEQLPFPKRLLVLADHGFTELKSEVCINTWLKHNGYLQTEGTPASEWDARIIAPSSQAFALDPGRIYIHDSRFARGCVSDNDKAQLMDSIREGLMALTLNGERVMEEVHTGCTLYPGSTSPQTPDLICQTRPGFDLKAKFDRSEIFSHHGRTGTHTVHGAVFYDSEGSTPERMRETGKIILNHFNILEQ